MNPLLSISYIFLSSIPENRQTLPRALVEKFFFTETLKKLYISSYYVKDQSFILGPKNGQNCFQPGQRKN